MKRTALARKTPLRRVPLRPYRRKDPVPAWLRPYIGSRDRQCVMATLDSEHVCRNAFGDRIAPDHSVWEMDHIDGTGFGKRGPSVPWNCVRLCYYAHRLKTENARKWRPPLRRYAMAVEARDVA